MLGYRRRGVRTTHSPFDRPPSYRTGLEWSSPFETNYLPKPTREAGYSTTVKVIPCPPCPLALARIIRRQEPPHRRLASSTSRDPRHRRSAAPTHPPPMGPNSKWTWIVHSTPGAVRMVTLAVSPRRTSDVTETRSIPASSFTAGVGVGAPIGARVSAGAGMMVGDAACSSHAARKITTLSAAVIPSATIDLDT